MPPTRRQVITSIGLLTIGSSGYALLASDSARAAVTMDTLTVADGATSTEDGTVPGVWVTLDGNYDYETVDFEATGWEARLIVADAAQNYAEIASVHGNASGFDGNGSFAIDGDVLAHDDFDATDFTAGSDGASVTTTVYVRLRFAVLVDGAELTDAMVEDTADVTVENTGSNAELTASLGGDGSVVFADPSA